LTKAGAARNASTGAGAKKAPAKRVPAAAASGT